MIGRYVAKGVGGQRPHIGPIHENRVHLVAIARSDGKGLTPPGGNLDGSRRRNGPPTSR